MAKTNTEMVEIVVNGQPRIVPASRNLIEVLAILELEADRVAIEMDREIVRKPLWLTTPVPAGAILEIVQFVGGG